jgi:hypothetical protein
MFAACGLLASDKADCCNRRLNTWITETVSSPSADMAGKFTGEIRQAHT